MAFTEIPLQPAKKQASQEPAAPIAGAAPAQRPALTAAELAAKDRADKIARKQAAKAKGPAEASPVEVVDPPDPEAKAKASSKRRKKKERKPKEAKQSKAQRPGTGAKLRMLLIGLPIVVVLGGAGTFAYLNKEKLGFGNSVPAAGGTSGAAVAPSQPGGGAGSDQINGGIELEDESVIGINPFEPFTPPTPEEQAPPVQLDEPPAPLVFSAKELQEIVKDPRRTLEAFLLAGTPDDLINFVTDREQVEEEIRAYYRDGKRIPIATRGIEEGGSKIIPGTSFTACMYWVTSNRRRIPVSVEETTEGYRVDWAAFTQFHDARFEKFMRDPNSPPGEFYVQMRRSHFFGNSVPDLDELQAFRVGSPIAPFPDSYAFLRKSNPEASSILARYRWSVDYLPVVELKWVKPDGDEPRIELQRVIRHAWRR